MVFDESRCIGCRACMQACPFMVPKYDYDSFAPKIHKCTFCADRMEVGMDPACAKVCPTGAITFGDRDDMVAEAKRRIATAPGTYIPEIYGLDEVGGTSVLHLSSVPFEKIGYVTGLPKDADAGPHASLAARHRAGVRAAVCSVRRAQLDRAPAHAPPRTRGRAQRGIAATEL